MPRVDECVVNVMGMNQRHRNWPEGRRFVVHTRCSSDNSRLATGSHALLRKACLDDSMYLL
jgi:hypothetical protein